MSKCPTPEEARTELREHNKRLLKWKEKLKLMYSKCPMTPDELREIAADDPEDGGCFSREATQFRKLADWLEEQQAEQSPWVRVKDRLPDVKEILMKGDKDGVPWNLSLSKDTPIHLPENELKCWLMVRCVSWWMPVPESEVE